MSYAKCKFLSWKYNIPIFCTPFAYSNYLCLDHPDEKGEDADFTHFKSQRVVSEATLLQNLNKNPSEMLYTTDYYLRFSNSYSTIDPKDKSEGIFDLAIQNPNFHQALKETIKPIQEIKPISIPPNCISIALHVRKGIGYDLPLASKQFYNFSPEHQVPKEEETTTTTKKYADVVWKTKFPPEQYYIDQLALLSDLLDAPEIYVHLFTDHPNPRQLVKQYEKVLKRPNIRFGYRRESNHHNQNVLEDLFNMIQFDCLIRSSSSFSQIVQLIGNHKLIIIPLSGTWYKDILLIDAVELIIPDRNNHELKRYRIDQINPKILTHLIRESLKI